MVKPISQLYNQCIKALKKVPKRAITYLAAVAVIGTVLVFLQSNYSNQKKYKEAYEGLIVKNNELTVEKGISGQMIEGLEKKLHNSNLILTDYTYRISELLQANSQLELIKKDPNYTKDWLRISEEYKESPIKINDRRVETLNDRIVELESELEKLNKNYISMLNMFEDRVLDPNQK